MDKLDILFRKLCDQYDEDFTLESRVPTEEEFINMANNVRSQIRYTYEDAEFISIREQVRELRAASIGLGISIDSSSRSAAATKMFPPCWSTPPDCARNPRWTTRSRSTV